MAWNQNTTWCSTMPSVAAMTSLMKHDAGIVSDSRTPQRPAQRSDH
jgi:hypothetical protein